MKKDDLIEIITNGESSKVEFKTEDVHPTALAEEIVAFANFEGGTILIGIQDDGTIAGCSRKGLEEFIVNVCRNNVNPSILPVIERVVVDDKFVFVVEIQRGETAYCTNKGLYFIRVGSTKQTPTQQELLRLFQKRNILQFDETPVLKASIESIDIAKVKEYLVRLEQTKIDEENEKAIANELKNLSILIEVEKSLFPTVGGLLAFGKHPQTYFPAYAIMCGAYRGDDFLSDTIREKEIKGTFNELIEDTIAFVKLTIDQDRSLDREIQRKDVFQYPIEAIREGIVNAICHRDYTISGSSIRVFVFKNSIEIHSPGGLPNTLTLENMVFRQFTRNQMVASFLTGYGYMERRGKGIQRMISLCAQRNIKCDISLSKDASELVVRYQIKP
jgi:ATP-dependent DNA helicase RecG